MLQSPYRKEWVVGTNIAKGLIGTSVGSRIPTITEYAEEFSCSRGIVQNALAYLEDQNVITLDRMGKKGTFLHGKQESELFRFSGLTHLTASMPPPINRHFAGLATGVCQGMTRCPVPFTFAFQQGSRNRIQALCSGAYDFVVISKNTADEYGKKFPEIGVAFAFQNTVYSPPYKLYLNSPGKTEVEDGMTVAIDPSSFDQVAITKRLCLGKRVRMEQMPFVSAAYAFYTGKIDGLVFRDGMENSSDNLLNLMLQNKECITPDKISRIDIPEENTDMERPVALVHRDNYGITGILENYLSGNGVGMIQKKVLDGTMVPQFY